jgi:hypothetical protein
MKICQETTGTPRTTEAAPRAATRKVTGGSSRGKITVKTIGNTARRCSHLGMTLTRI